MKAPSSQPASSASQPKQAVHEGPFRKLSFQFAMNLSFYCSASSFVRSLARWLVGVVNQKRFMKITKLQVKIFSFSPHTIMLLGQLPKADAAAAAAAGWLVGAVHSCRYESSNLCSLAIDCLPSFVWYEKLVKSFQRVSESVEQLNQTYTI